MSRKEKKLDIEVSHGSDPLIEEITQNIGVEPNKIHFMDILYNAIEDDSDSHNFSAFIYGTDQERHHEEGRNNHPYKQYCSGPLAKSKSSTAQREAIGRMGVLLPSPEKMRQQAQNVFADFARRLVEKELADSKESKPSQEFKAEERIEKPIKWLLSGHSRGGMIARILANPKPKTCILEKGITVMISAPDLDNTRQLIIVKNKNGQVQRKKYILEMNVLNFSATGGPRLKGVEDFVETRPVRLLDFLAVRDTGNGYGQGMKPFNQRRTISPNTATTFLHIPVNHPSVTKADKKRLLHMEIELLTTYLYFKHMGYSINVNKLKIPVRLTCEKTKKNKTELVGVILSNGEYFSSDNCKIKDCIDTLQVKLKALNQDKEYAISWRHTDVHGKNDRRFLVLRSEFYSSSLEENLALAQLEDKDEAKSLDNLFGDNVGPEVKKFQAFAQLCLAKNGLHDQHLENPKNANQFFLLKAAAILKDQIFVDKLFKEIDFSFNNQYHDFLKNPALKIKDSILKFLENKPVSVNAAQLKAALFDHLPTLVNEKLLESLSKLKPSREDKVMESKSSLESKNSDTKRKEIKEVKSHAEKEPTNKYLYKRKEMIELALSMQEEKMAALKYLNIFVKGAVENLKFISIKDRSAYKEEIEKTLDELVKNLPEAIKRKEKIQALKKIFPPISPALQNLYVFTLCSIENIKFLHQGEMKSFQQQIEKGIDKRVVKLPPKIAQIEKKTAMKNISSEMAKFYSQARREEKGYAVSNNSPRQS